MDKNKKIVVIVITFIITFLMIGMGCQGYVIYQLKESNDKLVKANAQKDIQINSLWDNVQQLQNDYAGIVDILYNPNNPHYLGL